jgi:hypothetical protein
MKNVNVHRFICHAQNEWTVNSNKGVFVRTLEKVNFKIGKKHGN